MNKNHYIDANVLIYTLNYWNKTNSSDDAKAAAFLVSKRSFFPLATGLISIGEAIEGCKFEKDTVYLARIMKKLRRVYPLTEAGVRVGDRLYKRLGRKEPGAEDRKSKRRLHDVYEYATAGLSLCPVFISRDSGFIGAGNRKRIPRLARKSGLRHCPVIATPQETLPMRKNPQPKSTATGRSEGRALVAAHRLRARRRAAAAGCVTAHDRAIYFAGVAIANGY
jgi:hypothetical protein